MRTEVRSLHNHIICAENGTQQNKFFFKEYKLKRLNKQVAAISLAALAVMPVCAQDVVANAASGMNAAATTVWAPRLSAVAIVLGALGIGLVGGHAMKAVIASVTLATLIAINANTIVGWIQAIS